MSLVNDALKRASQLHKQKSLGTVEMPPLQTVEYQPPTSRLPAILAGVIALLLALAAWFLWQWMKVADRLHTAEVGQTVAATEMPRATAAGPLHDASPLATITETPATVTPEPARTVTETKPPVVVTSPPEALPPAEPLLVVNTSKPFAAATAPPPSAPVFPELKVQGIFFSASNPSALVNGITVYKGDTVRDVRVVDIQRNKVIVELQGQRKTFVLAQ